ncbi:MAG: AAA family ATPase [Nitrospira sp.]|nr:MAG: AAA family ATPase [Nitrospira sp.]
MPHTFRVTPHNQALKENPRSVFVLETDNWDDFGHKVNFALTFVDESGKKHVIGQVKILQRERSNPDHATVVLTTQLPTTFSELDNQFVSLGQEDDYYKNLQKLFAENVDGVLIALQDIAWQPALAEPFETTPAFRNALMRNNSAHRARKFGRVWALGESFNEHLSFRYLGRVDGAGQPIEVKFELDGNDDIPGRVVGIIGRNAVGKTRFLSSLSEDLAQISRTSAEGIAERERRFPDGRPLFNRIIAISYSAFDKFKRPPSDSSYSYVYCGIRNDRGAISQSTLIDAYHRNQTRIRNLKRGPDWTRHMQTILGDISASLATSPENKISVPDQEDQALSFLSSGQSILCHFVTALLAWIQPNTLVLFDEPETHLHPNAVASLFLVLTDILKNNDSYAVVATHSPVVIQEIPSKRVIVFRRAENITSAEPLALESFGESVAELTRHVFETVEVESLYRKTLKELSRHMSAEEVLIKFSSGLSLSAQAYLLAQYGRKNS